MSAVNSESVGLQCTLVESRLPLIETLIFKKAIEHAETTQVYFKAFILLLFLGERERGEERKRGRREKTGERERERPWTVCAKRNFKFCDTLQ